MAKHTARATCRLTAFGEAVLTFPYSAALVATLKASIPYRFRDWDPTSKTWTIEPAYVDVAIELLLDHFPDAETPRRGRTRTTPTAPLAGSAFAVLHLLPTAPPELIDAAYRTLAKRAHPDVGGDSATMRRLTEAHESLSRRLGA